MKNRKLSNIIGTLCVVTVLVACCITDQKGDPCWVNYGLLALATILGIGSKKTEVRNG